ncbi:MAG TPA: 4-hydroxy-tetrahydrodipicolinate reductase, partial [Thiothrix sp.]|nr:4-hydroxy-tetrahydrodipicolinate reductase [Thiothrix sp.]
MSTIKVAIVGAGGRMGKTLLEACAEAENTELTVATERAGSSLVGVDANELAGLGKSDVHIVDSLDNATQDFDVLIDFTRPEPTMAHLAWCVKNKKSIIIGTTGFSDDEKQQITEASKEIPIVFAPNFS